MADLFMSYSRRDQGFARQLHARLEQEGKDVWVDWENIPLTAEWLQEIYDGIEAADAFAYVISPDSVRSEVCSLELAHAISHNKRLVPLLRRDLVEDMDKKALDPKISSHNWIFFRETDDFEKAFASLIESLNTDLDHLKIHTRLLIKAVEWNGKERDNSLVLRGGELRQASQWLQQSADKQPAPTDLQREFVTASQRTESARLRTLLLTGMYVTVVFALAVFAFYQAVNAENRRQEADTQRQLAEAAKATAVYNGDQARSLALASNAQQILYRDANPELALALALEANISVAQPPLLAQSALAQAAYFPGLRYDHQGVALFARVASDPAQGRALLVSADNALVLWDLESRTPLQTWTGENAEDPINAVALTPDGRYAMAAANSGQITIYDTQDGTLFQTFTDPGGAIWNMKVSPDGAHLVTAIGDGRARVWDWRTGENTVTFEDHVTEAAARNVDSTQLFALDIRADSRAALTVDSGLGLIMQWDIETGERLSLVDLALEQSGWTLAYVPDGDRAIVGFENNLLYLVNLESGEIERTFTGHSLRPWDVVVTPNGREALSASYDNTIIHWSLGDGRLIQTFRGHGSAVYGLALVGDRFISASSDASLRYWDINLGSQLAQQDLSAGAINKLVLSRAPTPILLAGTASGSVVILDEALTPQQTLEMPADLRTMSINPTGELVAAGTRLDVSATAEEPRFITIRRLADGELIAQTQLPYDVLGLAFQPDDTWLAVVGGSVDVLLWNWETDERRTIPLAPPTTTAVRLRSVAFSADGTRLLTSGIGGLSEGAVLVDVASGEMLAQYTGAQGVLYQTVFSADERFIAAGTEDNTILVWPVDQPETPLVLYGHTEDVETVEFSRDGRFLVSASYDNTARLWDVREGSEIQRFDSTADILSAVFAADEAAVFTANQNGVIQEWEIRDLPALLTWIDANRYVPELTCEQSALYQIAAARCDS